jgi:hypothetical protein
MFILTYKESLSKSFTLSLQAGKFTRLNFRKTHFQIIVKSMDSKNLASQKIFAHNIQPTKSYSF